MALAGIGLVAGLSACGDKTPTGADGNGGAAAGGGGGGGGGGGSIGTGGKSLGTAKVTLKATDADMFDPKTTNAAVGDVVEWDNSGSQAHNITFADDQNVGDQSFSGGDKWQIKFTKAGTYKYQCTIHPGMEGEIVIK
ncbi:MAG: plastocyanin/azurin family copper-binding protein [Candidatus Dormibacteria bacterium]